MAILFSMKRDQYHPYTTLFVGVFWATRSASSGKVPRVWFRVFAVSLLALLKTFVAAIVYYFYTVNINL